MPETTKLCPFASLTQNCKKEKCMAWDDDEGCKLIGGYEYPEEAPIETREEDVESTKDSHNDNFDEAEER